MDLHELVTQYLTKLETITDLVDIKPALQDEDDTLMSCYGAVAKSSIVLTKMTQEYQQEADYSRQLNAELKVKHLMR